MAEPKVRFKRDDGSSYPVWVSGKLGDITEKVNRKAPKGSTAPVMMVSQSNGFIYQADKYSRENAGQSLKNYTLLKQGEFAYNHGASKAKPYGVAYCLMEESEARVPFVYHTFKIKDGVNSYWHEALNTNKMDRQLKRMVSSGARMDGLLNINYETYMDVAINIPCEEEQQKIADFLSSVDEVITASEAEVANLETQKKAVMKKIFSREVRFRREDGTDFSKWKDTTLGTLEGKVSSGKDKNEDGNVPLYGSTGPIGTCATATHIGNKILVARVGANAGSVRLVTEDCGVTDNTLIIKDCESCNFGWLYYALAGKDIGKMRFGGGQPLVTGTMLFDLKMEVPCLEEQCLIADFLSSFDEAIAAAKKELELWKELKKGLLQQMFV